MSKGSYEPFLFCLPFKMVMEFPDNVLNLDGHQNNGAQLKQFIQVKFYNHCFLIVYSVCFKPFNI